MSTKYNVFSLGAGLVLLHLWTSRSLRNTLLAAGCAGLVLSPWLLKNLLFFANPVYPFVTGSSRLADWTGFITAAHVRTLSNIFGSVQGFKEFLLTPWKISQGPVAMGDWPGPAFIVFLPWVFLLRWKNSVHRLVPIAALIAYLAWSMFSHQGRFLIAGLAIIAYMIALSINQTAIPSSIRTLGWSFAIAACAINLSAFNHDPVIKSKWNYWKDKTDKTMYLADERPGYPAPPFLAINFINRNLPMEAQVLFIGDARGYYSERRFIAPSVYDHNPLWVAVRSSRSAQEIAANLKSAGITHLLLNGRGLYIGSIESMLPPADVRSTKFREFHERFLKIVFTDHEKSPSKPVRWLSVFEVQELPLNRPNTSLNFPEIVLGAREHK